MSLFPLPYEKTSVDFFALFIYMHFSLAFQLSMQHVFNTILPAASTSKTLADCAALVSAKHRKLPSGIAPPEKKQLSKSVQIPSKLFWSAKSISVKNQVPYEQKLVKSIEIKPEILLSDLLNLFFLP